MKKILKKYQDYFIVFSVTVLLLSLIFIITGFFTDNSTLIAGDLKAQYMPLFSKYKEILVGNGSLFYALNKGIGGGFLGTFFYYLSSPLNLLIIFFEVKNFYLFILLLFSLKVVFSSITMYTYLKKHFYNIPFHSLLMFTIMYSFSSYMVGYLFNIMWLDALYLLPILLLGIEELINQKKFKLYSITLLISIYCNYYIGYMLCLFSVIYFFYYSCIHYKNKVDFKENCVKFFTVSLFTGLLCSFFLLPSLIDFLNSTHVFSLNEGESILNVDNKNFLAYFFLNGNKTIDYLNKNFYYLYAGILIFPLIVLYFFHKDISKREKGATFIVFLIFIISILFPFVDKIWHLFSNPMYYAGRYSFLIIFFSIIISCRSFEEISKLDKKYYFYIAPIFPIGGYILYLVGTTSIWMVYINSVLYLLYIIISYNLGKEKKLVYFLEILVFSEIFFSFSYSLEQYRLRSSWKEELLGYHNSIEEEITFIKENDKEDFYRIYESHLHTSNPGFYFDYNGIDVFYSTVNEKVMKFMRPFSYEARLNDVNYSPTNEVINSLLGIKYIILEGEKNDNALWFKGKNYSSYPVIYEHSMPIGTTYLYGVFNANSYILENKNVLPLGFMVSGRELIHENFLLYSTSYDLSNDIFNSMFLKDINVYEKIIPEKIGNSYFLSNLKDENIVVLMKNKENKFFSPILYLNGKEWISYGKSTVIEVEIPRSVIIDNKVEFSYTLDEEKEIDIYFYRYNEKAFKESIKELKENTFEIEVLEDTYIKGNVSATEEFSTLFLSIPKEDGWNIYVDGKKQNVKTLYNTFIGVELKEGNHVIELKYFPPGLKTGIVISLFSLLGLCIINRKNKVKD